MSIKSVLTNMIYLNKWESDIVQSIKFMLSIANLNLIESLPAVEFNMGDCR